jgi:hypothetical protein
MTTETADAVRSGVDRLSTTPDTGESGSRRTQAPGHSILISAHTGYCRGQDGRRSSLPVTTAGVSPTRPGRRRRPPRRRARPSARTRGAADPGLQRVPAPLGTTLRLLREPGHEREQPADIGQIGLRVQIPPSLARPAHHPHGSGRSSLVHILRSYRPEGTTSTTGRRPLPPDPRAVHVAGRDRPARP